MRSIVRGSLTFRLLVLPIAVAVAVVGVMQLRNTPVDVLPEFTPPYVEIQTEALGLSAPEVEALITVPMERDLLNGVQGIDVIRSQSVAGVSSVVLVFETGTDLLGARQLVQERLGRSKLLPNVSKPPTMLQPMSSESRVMMIGLSSKRLSPIDLGLLARWTIRQRLMGISGVANVVIWGQREHQLQVQVDPARLRANDVSLQQIVSTVGNSQLVSPLSFLEASTPGSGGFIDTPNQRLQVRHVLPISNPEGLAQVPVDQAEGKPVPTANGKRMQLGDVADVVVEHQPLIGDAIVDGGPGLMLVIEKFAGADTLEVTHKVDKALDALRPGLSGVAIDSQVFRPASYIESAIDNLTLALLAAAVLLVIVLLGAFIAWRTAVVALVTIPLSLIAAGLVLSLRGETINALVLVGLVLAVGVVVDDAVVGVDAVRRRLRGRTEPGDESLAAAIVDATSESRGPLVPATLIVLVTAVPILFLAGQLGDFFGPLALSYALAALASMVVALTLTPVLCLLLFRHGDVLAEPPLLRWLTPRYGAAFSSALRRRNAVLVGAGVVAVAVVVAVPLAGVSVTPTFKERALLIQLEGAPGASQPAMVRAATRIGRDVRSIPGVRDVGAHIGRAVMGDRVSGTNAGELWVSLQGGADYGLTVARIRNVVDGYPGLKRRVVTYTTDRIRTIGSLRDGKVQDDDRRGVVGALTAADEPLIVRVYGSDFAKLRQEAKKVRALMQRVDGVVSPRIQTLVDEPALEVTPNLAAAREYGIKPGDVRRAAATLVEGIVVGSLFEQQKVFDVIVVGSPAARRNLTAVRNIRIDVAGGRQVRLSDVASVGIAPSPAVIDRSAASRVLDVTADVSGRDLGAVISDVEEGLRAIEFPLEYHAEVMTEATARHAANIRFLGLVLIAVIAILLLLQAALGSWRLATMFFLTAPVALAGGVVAALVVDGRITLGALAGLLALFAVVCRQGACLVARYRRVRRDRGAGFSPADLLPVTREQLGPILMTALATVAVLVPLIALGQVAGNEITHTLALVVAGGLITVTAFSLLFVPVLYVLFGSSDELDEFGVRPRRRLRSPAATPQPAAAPADDPTR